VRRRLLYPLIFILFVAGSGLAAVFATGSSPELGLDLQGGVSVVLEPTKKTDDDKLDVALDIIRTRVDALGVAEPEIARQGDSIIVQLPGVENTDRALELVGATAELRFRPVLSQEIPLDSKGNIDLGDTSTTTTAPADPNATTTTTAPPASDTTNTSEGALGSGSYGMAEGEFAGVVQEPTDTTVPTETTVAPDPNATTTTTAPTDTGVPTLTTPEEDTPEATVLLPDKDNKFALQLGPVLATGKIVQTAKADIPNGVWQVSLTMRGGANGIDKFNEIVAKCYQAADPTVCPSGRLAIVLDGVVQSAPNINNPSYERDSISITGDFSESEAKDLALVLKYGSLPVELKRQTVQRVSASLGEDSLRAGIVAGTIGVVLVALYMVLYYRALGLVVIAGMAVWGSLLYTIISWLGATQGLALTLAGVTGIIVSVGVTVDSYVVYFERLKDEVKSGRTLRTSTERAFQRAFRTILAADTSSFIGAAVLWWLTVGSVRGFAFFLGLSTVLDVVVAWFFTRPVVTYLSRNDVFTYAPFFGVARGMDVEPGATAPAPAGAAR
jgi:preprotein translocase subunit SecD